MSPDVAVAPPGWTHIERRLNGDLWRCRWGRCAGMTVISSVRREGDGRRWLHVSCARSERIPSWRDLKEVRRLFTPPDRPAYSVMPPADRYVNIHPNCLHLFVPLEGPEPMPEFSTVGPLGREL